MQRYLHGLFCKGEISEEEKKGMRPMAAQLGRAHGLPKIHKEFDTIPEFRPIIDTTGTPYYEVGKFLAKLLNPLTMNEFSLKDSFDATKRIQNIPDVLFEKGYRFVSFDVKSLFTNVPLAKTIDIILNRVYDQKLIETKLKRRSLKKLISDVCKKTTFSFNNQLYEQLDGVSMGSSLGPVLANIIMTELENVLIKDLLDTGTIAFYARYVDDTLVLVKPNDVQKVLNKLNSFHKNLKFTVDTFPDDIVHFLDIKIDGNKTDVYRKETHTGQYVQFSSFEPWFRKTAWIKCLVERAEKICSDKKLFENQLSKIKSFMSWNGFPKYVGRSIIKKTLQKKKGAVTDKSELDEIPKIWFRIPYIGPTGEQLAKRCISKLKRCSKEDLNFILLYDTKKLSFFCSNKDPVPENLRAHVIYEFQCPGCKAKYIGKTDRCLGLRLDEHSHAETSAIGKYLNECEHFHFIVNLYNISVFSDLDQAVIQHYYHIHAAVLQNTRIIDKNNNWSQLCFLESLYIKRRNPTLNVGIKATKELVLFR